MDSDTLRLKLLQKPLTELYGIRGDQYTSKEAIVEDIIANDDGSVAEMVEGEGSFLNMMTRAGFFEGLKNVEREQKIEALRNKYRNGGALE